VLTTREARAKRENFIVVIELGYCGLGEVSGARSTLPADDCCF
jgi:hypothetical protein